MNNYYEDPELNENPPSKPDISKLTRHILVEKPRVTKFQIDWEDQHHFNMPNGVNDENNQNVNNMMAPPVTQEGMLSKGSQFQDRNDMMSQANLAQAAQSFYNQ